MSDTDLIILTADKNTEALLQALVPRLQKIENLHQFSYDIIIHPKRDSGVATNCHDFLRLYLTSHRYCVIILDYEGSGKEGKTIEELEGEIEGILSLNGWKDRTSCIVIEPELEMWLWVNPVKIHGLIDWEENVNVYDWLKNRGLEFNGTKPVRPKEAFEMLLRYQHIPRSSSLYAHLAGTASYRKCKDAAFHKLRSTLIEWFQHLMYLE